MEITVAFEHGFTTPRRQMGQTHERWQTLSDSRGWHGTANFNSLAN